VPLVGFHSWFEWLEIGRQAARTYSLDTNWVFLSRDLINLPRRWLFDFQSDPSRARELTADITGVFLLIAVLEITVRLLILRKDRATDCTGPTAAFVLLGSWFSCYHFMYYDVLLTALPMYLLLSGWGRYLHPRLLIAHDPRQETASVAAPQYYEPRWANLYPGSGGTKPALCLVLNSMTLSLIALFAVADLMVPGLGISVSVSAGGWNSELVPMPLELSTALKGTPWNLFCLLALWLWCGWLALREGAEADAV
jgi:hypothetical protein